MNTEKAADCADLPGFFEQISAVFSVKSFIEKGRHFTRFCLRFQDGVEYDQWSLILCGGGCFGRGN